MDILAYSSYNLFTGGDSAGDSGQDGKEEGRRHGAAAVDVDRGMDEKEHEGAQSDHQRQRQHHVRRRQDGRGRRAGHSGLAKLQLCRSGHDAVLADTSVATEGLRVRLNKL